MHRTFVEVSTTARALLVATLVGALVLETAATYLGRARGTGRKGVLDTVRLAFRSFGEVATTRGPGDGRAAADRGTKQVIVWSAAGAFVLAWLATRHLPGARMPGSGWTDFAIGLALVWAGYGLRAWAVVVLGRFFRRVVVVQEGHEVVRSGPYRLVRHPAYAGNLIAFAGFGILLGNWVSLAALTVIPLAGHLPRIRVEEAELERKLGELYREYERVTRRLVPGVW